MPNHYPDHPNWELLPDLDQYELRACMVHEWRVLTALHEAQEQLRPPWAAPLGTEEGAEWLKLALLIQIHLGHWYDLQRRHDRQDPWQQEWTGSIGIMQIQSPELEFDREKLRDPAYNVAAALKVWQKTEWNSWKT